jgi:intein/homing endonuclease
MAIFSPQRTVRTFSLHPQFLEQFHNRQPKWGPLGFFTYKRTYARPIEGNGRVEEFWETLHRVVDGVYNVQKIHCRNLGLPWDEARAQRSAQEMFQRMWDFKFLPPGRGLWMMGTSYVLERGSAALNNCAFISTQDIDVDFADPFCFLMDMCMVGSGVGGDTKGAGKVRIQEPRYSDKPYVVEDTREAWVDLVRVILNSFAGKGFFPKSIDYSKVRLRGAPIKGFGGISSGPEPLMLLVKSITDLLKPKDGLPYRITSEQIVDIFNFIGKCIVAGNVRRSSEIMLGDIDDDDFLALKQDPVAMKDRRWASNNSIFARVGMDYSKVVEPIAENGEPGIFWLKNAQRYSRMVGWADNKDFRVSGINPCGEQSLESGEMCLSADTRILTDEGYKSIGELAEQQDVKVATPYLSDEVFEEDPRFCQATVFTTGVKPTLKITTVDGRVIECTENHPFLTETSEGKRWVKAEELHEGSTLVSGEQEIDENGPSLDPLFYTLGHFAGDGWFLETNGRRHVGVCCGSEERPLLERLLPVWQQFVEESASYIKSNYEARYDVPLKISEAPNGVLSITITKPQVFRRLRDGFGFSPAKAPDKRLPMGYWEATPNEKRSFIRGLFDADGTVLDRDRKAVSLTASNRAFAQDVLMALSEFGVKGRICTSKIKGRDRTQTVLMVRGKENLLQFARHFWFVEGDLGYSSSKAEKLLTVIARMPTHTPITKKSVIRKIIETGEQLVFNLEVPEARHYIAEGLVVHNCNLVETFPANHDTFDDYRRTLKYAYLYAKSVTLIPTHNDRTNAVMGRNRRIGCSMTGIIQAIQKFGRRTFLKGCNKGYEYINELDKKYSDWLCIPRSIKMTTVKPSGTVSLLSGATPGIHYPQSEYYIRNIRVMDTSPLVEMCRRAGYPVEPDKMSPNTQVVSFPVKERGFVKAKKDVTIWEQFANAADMQQYWTDNQVSITITFKPEERADIQSCLEHFETKLKAVTLLPLADHGYEQAPYITITKEEYEEAMAGISELDLSGAEHDILAEDKFCDGDSCAVALEPFKG